MRGHVKFHVALEIIGAKLQLCDDTRRDVAVVACHSRLAEGGGLVDRERARSMRGFSKFRLGHRAVLVMTSKSKDRVGTAARGLD